MVKEPSKTTLTPVEKAVIKALLLAGERNQDIHTLVNTGRPATINFGRIAGVKANQSITPATPEQVKAFRDKKLRFDHVTGLCPIDDERLVRAREAMILAVGLFNTPRLSFKAGVFSMLTNVAWTYLLHQYYENRGVTIIGKDGYSLLLSKMIERSDCPLSKSCKQNIAAVKEIRDVVEHLTIGQFDVKWNALFQANCLNFERALTDLFGPRVTLGNELGFALQFAKLSTKDIATLQGASVPEHIASLDASLASKLGEGDADNIEYQFKVVYTLTNASKAKADFQFIQPGSAEGVEIQNILIKYKPLDDIYPLKPSDVVKEVTKMSGRPFTHDKHTRAWKMFKVRPKGGASEPHLTDKEFCTYHAPYKSYAYSQAWVEFLVKKIADNAVWDALRSFNTHE